MVRLGRRRTNKTDVGGVTSKEGRGESGASSYRGGLSGEIQTGLEVKVLGMKDPITSRVRINEKRYPLYNSKKEFHRGTLSWPRLGRTTDENITRLHSHRKYKHLTKYFNFILGFGGLTDLSGQNRFI